MAEKGKKKVEVGYGEKAVGKGEDLLIGEGEPQPTKLTTYSNFSWYFLFT
jgi:hypothetical protein